MGWLAFRTLPRGRIGVAALLIAALACGGGRPEPSLSPTTTEQTLADLFNLTALYQRMGRLAAGRPLPWVGQFAYFAGRGDSTIALLGLSLDNRALSFQREGREFRARYRVEVMFQRAGALPIRHAREEAVVVASFLETQRGDETILYQQAFLLPPGEYQTTVTVRDPGSVQFSRAEATITLPALRPGTVGAPILVYAYQPREDLTQEPSVLLNPRGTVAHGGDSLVVLVEAYGLPGVTRVPVVMRDERGAVLLQDELVFHGGRPVEQRAVRVAPDVPSLGRLNVAVGAPGMEKSTDALVSFSRSWVLTNYDNLLDLLRFFGHEDRLAELRRAAPSERPALWRQFWRDTDPNPETPENEALDRYFTRLVIANERFREEAPQGWRTERGEVFITLGPPDQEIESPPRAGDNRVVQWAYNEYRTVLTFVGQYGFSRLRLTPASRAEFTRLRALVRQRERAELEERRQPPGRS